MTSIEVKKDKTIEVTVEAGEQISNPDKGDKFEVGTLTVKLPSCAGEDGGSNVEIAVAVNLVTKA